MTLDAFQFLDPAQSYVVDVVIDDPDQYTFPLHLGQGWFLMDYQDSKGLITHLSLDT